MLNWRDKMRPQFSCRWLALFSVISLLVCGPSAAQAGGGSTGTETPLWRDPSRPVDERVQDLISRMTLAEKVAQIHNEAPAIKRLGVPVYNYWNECLHGVARNGIATVFPQAIGMAASWDTPLLHDVADTIATEARAKHREYSEKHDGDSKYFTGLNFWTPNINIFRDPRWGRGQETYGEDPFLTARMAVAFIQGLQGNDPKYLKAMACAKHFAVHSGPEATRHQFNVVPAERDLYETYLPQFEAAVREGHVGAVMGAYNRVDGVPCVASPFLLTDLLRHQWGFDGHVVSDCGAIGDIFKAHGFTETADEAAALALRAGCDLGCWGESAGLTQAVARGLIAESDVDVALGRVLKARFRLGLFDPPAMVSYAQIPVSENDTPAHSALSLRMARESIVLLRNNGLLPLDRTKMKHIAVVGFNAVRVEVLLGNYNGDPSHPVTIWQGITNAVGTNGEVGFAQGCPLAAGNGVNDTNALNRLIAQAVDLAKRADVVIYCGGLSPLLENEEMEVPAVGFSRGDRTRIELPTVQTDTLKALQATGRPVVFVNCSGSAVAMPWEAENLSAIVQVWYPGQEGGTAVADVLFGNVNPAGRLPVTFYRSTADLPEFTDYAMSNRTYRYFSGKPQFAFGHGLSYTKFDYKSVRSDKPEAGAADTVRVSLEVANTGARDGDEVVQVYFRHLNSAVSQPIQALCGFRRVTVAKGQSAPVEIEIPMHQLRYWNTNIRQYDVEAGKYELLVGTASDDIRAKIPLTIVAAK
jgi:beta-glucosidase